MERIAGLDIRALDRARTSRDPRFDGRFFIAVSSTGIYCRPICPARSPKRSNIRYFPTAAAAEAAGFRPCLRCRPEAAPGSPAWLGTSALVRRALRLIDDGALDDESLDALARRVGVGPRHLRRLFVAHVGASPLAVAHTRRRTPPRAVAAGGDIVLLLPFAEPFAWPQLLQFFAARAIPGVELVDAESYSRICRTDTGVAVVHVARCATGRALELRVTGASPRSLMAIAAAARRAFDVEADPDRIVRAFGDDRWLGPLVRRRPGTRLPGAWDPFECAVRAVLGQQVSLAAARTFAARLVARAGTRVADTRLTYAFPSAADLAGADLAGIGLTGARARTLTALAQAVVEGRVDFSAATADVVATLQEVPGIGPWTAQYVALRALADPDAFPAGDLVLRRAAASHAALRGVPLAASALERRAERWRPWRGYAAQHLWQSAASEVTP